MLRQANFVDRNHFADFLNGRGLVGAACEVGTHRGEWASLFLTHWNGSSLSCIDPWSVPPGYESQAALLPHPGDREEDYETCQWLLRKHKDRTCLLRCTSECAVDSFQDGTLDFVYLDGDHRGEQVEKDLTLWWPKVKPGGILAGHDFLSSEPYSAYEEVQPAVLAFAQGKGLDVYVVIEVAFQPWSFYLEKPV